MRTAEVASDVVIAASGWNRDGGLKHPRDDNFVDFDRGKTLIMSGNEKYVAEVIVGITDTGDSVLYDVVDMTPITFDIKEAESSTAATTQNAIGATHEDSAEDNVAQNSDFVNRNFSENAKKIDPSYGWDTIQDRVARATKHQFDYSIAHLLEDVNSVFNLIANIRKKENDSFVYSIQLNENKKIEASPSLGSPNGVLNRMLNAFNDSISRDTASVNRNFSENTNKYQDRDPDAAIRYSDRTFSYDELVAKGKIIGKLHAVNAKKIDPSNHEITEKNVIRRHGEVYFNYSIAHLLEDVKGVFEDTFSEDVYNRLSTKRKENDFSKNLLYQDRDPDSAYSNRTLLMNALKTTAKKSAK